MVSAATSTAWNRKLSSADIRTKVILTRLCRPLDNLAAFETSYQNNSATAPSGYAIRQALDQEYQKYLLRQHADARQARYRAGGGFDSEADLVVEDINNTRIKGDGVEIKPVIVKRDFFGRIVDTAPHTGKSQPSGAKSKGMQDYKSAKKVKGRKAWVSFHEGFSNAVRKPITLDELMRGF